MKDNGKMIRSMVMAFFILLIKIKSKINWNLCYNLDNRLEGVWINGELKCGSYSGLDEFGSNEDLPVIELENPNEVLQKSKEELKCELWVFEITIFICERNVLWSLL